MTDYESDVNVADIQSAFRKYVKTLQLKTILTSIIATSRANFST